MEVSEQLLIVNPDPNNNSGRHAPIAEELRRRVLDLEHVVIAGSCSLRVFVTGESLASAREVFNIASDVMTRSVG